MEDLLAHRVISPRLVHPEDAAKFRMEMTVIKEPSQEEPDADV